MEATLLSTSPPPQEALVLLDVLLHNCSSPRCKGLLRFYSHVVFPAGQALHLQCWYLQETLRKQDESVMFLSPQNKHKRSSSVIQSPEGMRGQIAFHTDHPAKPWKACWSLAEKGNICHDFSNTPIKHFLLQSCSKLHRETHFKHSISALCQK